MMTLKSIEEEASACRARCANMKIGDICLHLHHEVLAEMLTEPIENRISYILSDKPAAEKALRLRMIGPPIIDEQVMADATWQKASAELEKAEAAWLKAEAAWLKADAERHKAYFALQKAEAAWMKAYVERQKAWAAWLKASAELEKASAELEKAYVERQKASAAWLRADAERQKAYAEWQKASVEWQKAYEAHYKRLYPESPWDGNTIFAGPFAHLRRI